MLVSETRFLTYDFIASKSHRNTVVYTCKACQTSRKIPAPPVHDPSAPASRSQAAGSADAGPSIADQETSDGVDAPQEDATMLSDQATHSENGKESRIRPRRAKAIFSRPPPFFEQDIGHVIFKGNERLE